MAGSGIFKSYKRTDAILKESGYLKAYLNLVDDFTTLSEPGDTPAATGDAKIITDAHVWAAGKGPMSLYINNKTLAAPAVTDGAQGSLKFKWTMTCFLVGDGPVGQDLVESLLNEDLIAFVTDGCVGGQILQFGCDCSPANIVKGSFASGTLNGTDAKGYSFDVEAYCRFFYQGGDLTAR